MSNGKCILMHGDCIDLLKKIPEKSIDMICADMPYGTTNCKWDSTINLDLLWPELERIIKNKGAIVLFAQTPFDKVLGASNLKLLRYEWIWDKPHSTGFFNAKKMPMKSHENILVFYKELPTYNPIKTTGHERKTAKRSSCGSEIYGKEAKMQHYDSTERYPRSIQRFSSDKQKNGGFHPTQKPVDLISYLIKTYTNENDLVLDFCMGSGTAGVSALQNKRRFIGIEKQIDYVNIADERIRSET